MRNDRQKRHAAFRGARRRVRRNGADVAGTGASGREPPGPGKTFNFSDLSLEDKLEIGIGLKQGDWKVDEAVAHVGKSINGWQVSALPGDSALYDGDWLKRAAAAHNYALTFAAGQLPPALAFWSLTMYDGKTQLLIQNPINRYLINSPMLPAMKRDLDGSLTSYIQNKSPGAERQSNWLPAPAGEIYLVMRLYWPSETPPSILPAGEGTWRPPGIKRAA